MGGVTLAAMVAVAVVTYDEVHNLDRMPCPARYVSVLALFGAIGLLAGAQPRFAGVLAWAFVIALLVGQNSPVVTALTRRPKQTGERKAT